MTDLAFTWLAGLSSWLAAAMTVIGMVGRQLVSRDLVVPEGTA